MESEEYEEVELRMLIYSDKVLRNFEFYCNNLDNIFISEDISDFVKTLIYTISYRDLVNSINSFKISELKLMLDGEEYIPKSLYVTDDEKARIESGDFYSYEIVYLASEHVFNIEFSNHISIISKVLNDCLEYISNNNLIDIILNCAKSILNKQTIMNEDILENLKHNIKN